MYQVCTTMSDSRQYSIKQTLHPQSQPVGIFSMLRDHFYSESVRYGYCLSSNLTRRMTRDLRLPIYCNYRMLRNDGHERKAEPKLAMSTGENCTAQWGTSWQVGEPWKAEVESRSISEEQATAASATRSLIALNDTVHRLVPWLYFKGDALEVCGVLKTHRTSDDVGFAMTELSIDHKFTTLITVAPVSNMS